ncbi:MAG: outer membrane beta-barrel protein [Hyphomicrobiaceae bacterium]
MTSSATRTLFLAGFLAVGTGPAFAADLSGGPLPGDDPFPLPATYTAPWFVGVRGGVAFPGDTTFNAIGTDIDTSYQTGGFVGAFVGYDFDGGRKGGGGLRGELEVDRIWADVDSQTVAGTGAFTDGLAGGTTTATVGFANLYYDLPFSPGITPFLGGGIGIASVDFSDHMAGGAALLSDSDTGFAWNLTSGVDIALTESTDLELGYRYMQISGIDVTALSGQKSTVDLDDHMLFAGIKMRF